MPFALGVSPQPRAGIAQGGPQVNTRYVPRTNRSPFGRCLIACALILLCALHGGCAAMARKEIAQAQKAHGVSIDITPAAAATDLVGGNSLVAVRNTRKELEVFPYRATEGVSIHIATGLDLIGEAHSPTDVLATPFVLGAVQDAPGDTQGHMFVLNKGLWLTYLDLLQPNTTMWQDPHLRHELMHVIEVNALREPLLQGRPGDLLALDSTTLDKLANVDSAALLAGPHDVVKPEQKPYLDFCARYLAAAFGDLTGDALIDDSDMRLLRASPADFDADADGILSYADAEKRTGAGYSFAQGLAISTQLEMTAGLFGYRPAGFASPYGRTCPWEDKATVLELAVHENIFPAFYRDQPESDVARAFDRLHDIRRQDPVLARKIEILGIFLGNLEYPRNRNPRFSADYAPLMIPLP